MVDKQAELVAYRQRAEEVERNLTLVKVSHRFQRLLYKRQEEPRRQHAPQLVGTVVAAAAACCCYRGGERTPPNKR